MLQQLSDVIDELNTTNSILAKNAILTKYPEMKDIFKYVYDPMLIFHITSKSILKYKKNDIVKIEDTLFELLDNLSTRVWSGHVAIRKVLGYIKKNGHKELIFKIIDKDFKIRMGVKQINKVFPDLVKEFNVALAEPLNKQMSYFEQGGDWLIMRKLDGVRCICIIKDGKVNFYSREGNEFFTLNKVADVILKKLASKLKKPMVLDGEVCIIKDGLESFSCMMKEISKKDHTIENPRFKVFDCVSLEDFENNENDIEYNKRHKLAEKLVNKCKDDVIQCLEKVDYNETTFLEMQSTVQEKNWEGLMLRKNVGYEAKRTKNLLKVKTFHREEFKVVRIDSSEISNNGSEHAGKMGLKHAIILYKGFEVDIGSGFSCEERFYYHENPEDIVDKIISVQYFEEIKTKKKGTIHYSLRFPTFKGLYGVKRDH